jgi:outer membrane lipoprotein-sorting protein
MKRVVTLSLIGLMFVAALSAVPRPAAAQGPGLVSSILNRMDRNRRELKSLRSGLMMQKYNAQIRTEEMYQGELQYVAGAGANMNVRVDWTRPSREHLAVKNGQYTLFRPRLNLAYQGSTKAQQKNTKVSNVLGFGLNITGAQARTKFDIELVGEGILYDDVFVTQLKLTPKGPAGYQFAEVWVDRSGMPVQTRVVERNGDFTTVRLTGVQKNAPVSAGAFDLALPAGVKIVKG